MSINQQNGNGTELRGEDRTDRALALLASRQDRHRLMEEMTRAFLARQIREARRLIRNQTQLEMAGERAMPLYQIRGAEDTRTSVKRLDALFRFAEVFDLAVSVRLVDWPMFLQLHARSDWNRAVTPQRFDPEVLREAMAHNAQLARVVIARGAGDRR